VRRPKARLPPATGRAFFIVTSICVLAALLLGVFEAIAVRPAAAVKAAGNAWVRTLPTSLRTSR
jgi:ABC-type phosphate/phosphonate transport system permease subunit